MNQDAQNSNVKDQYVEVIGGPFDGEIYRHQYSPPSSPLFFITMTSQPSGNDYEYRMCVDGKFRLLNHADKFDSGILCDSDLHATTAKKKQTKPRKKRKP